MESTTIVFVLALASLFFSGAHSTIEVTFTFSNKCPYTIWPGASTNEHSSGTNLNQNQTGFELPSNASTTLKVSEWSGQLWARTQCSTDPSGKFTCATGDCGSGQVTCNKSGPNSPATIIRAINAGWDTRPYDVVDRYFIDVTDGFNLPVSIAPRGGGGCTATSCTGDINAVCPPEFAVKGSDGSVIACKGACKVLNQPRYCCTGAYDSPAGCLPSEYSKIFKAKCPQAFTYAYDNPKNQVSCVNGPNTYVITFCP